MSQKRILHGAFCSDRSKSKPVIMASTEGGMNIEEVAATHPDKIVKEWIEPSIGLQAFPSKENCFCF